MLEGKVMKNIKSYNAEKYNDNKYEKINEGIYKIGDEYVTSISFEQVTEYDEGDSPKYISQYPLEDLLDRFHVHISDFYDELNNISEKECYQEFASSKLENIENLRSIIGKHVYNLLENEAYKLIIE